TCVLLFYDDPAPSELYTLSLHDALPISRRSPCEDCAAPWRQARRRLPASVASRPDGIAALGAAAARASTSLRSARRPRSRLCFRSEEHTSELQSRENLVCRLLLEKKKKT